MKSKKIISILLTALTVLSVNPISAFAQSSIGSTSSNVSIGEDIEQKAKTKYENIKEGTAQTEVYLTIEDSDLIVSVPTTIILSGTPDTEGNYIGKYSVGVSGNLSGNKLVQVKPTDTSVELHQNGKLSKNAIITQERTRFDNNDLTNNIKTTGQVTANALTAGSWNTITSFELKIISKSDYDPLPSAKLLAENKDTNIYEDYDLFENGRAANIEKNEWAVTGNPANDIISTKMLYLPYGSAVRFNTNKLKNLGYTSGNPDIRLYQYSADGTYIGEVTRTVLAPNENNTDTDFDCTNFVVTNKEGMYVRFRWIRWENTFTENSKKDLQSVFTVHSLTAINAEIFDNTTLTKCWDNDGKYEAWATKNMFFNTKDNLYYAFYPSQPSHTEMTANIMYRTSSDLVNWSNSTIVYKNDPNNTLSMDGTSLCLNGDMLISLLNTPNGGENEFAYTSFLRSTDNGLTWEKQAFILNGQNVTGKYRIQRPRVLEDGRIFANYFDSAKVEKYGICYSEDNGKTWTSSNFTSKFVNPMNSEYDFVILNNGNILCVERIQGNDVSIATSISTDNGKSFINETSLSFIDENGQMSNCPFIRYDKENDRITIYEVDRFKTGGLVGIYTSGNNITDFLLNGSEFKGFQANVCSLGINGNADMGYPHIIDAPDGTVKCFYYNRIDNKAGTASWYSVSTINQ